jgi:hypothetical protein
VLNLEFFSRILSDGEYLSIGDEYLRTPIFMPQESWFEYSRAAYEEDLGCCNGKCPNKHTCSHFREWADNKYDENTCKYFKND